MSQTIPLAKMSDINATHTPGPWAVVRSNSAEGADVWWIVGNIGSHNSEKDIGSVQGGCSPTHEADAALIAAAPDLLDALYRIKTEAELDGMADRAGWDAWIRLANAAIAKTTVQAEA
jgi:hypothetical protein